MAEEIKENEFPKSDNQLPVESEYLEVSQQAAVRSVELPKEGEKPKTLTESMDEATDLTDMQFAAAHLFPKDIQPNDIMIGRVAPEAFMALLQFRITSDVMTSDPGKPLDLAKIVNKHYVGATIGLDGRGRIDYAELLGAAKEIRKEESLLKGL